MSLDAWEEHALKSIADDLITSAPELASHLLVFNRLTSGERMPGDPRAKGEERRAHGRTPPVIPVVAILAMVTAIMIAVALVLSGPGHPPAGTGASYCARAWPITCSGW